MTKLYLIVEGVGEYSDRWERPLWAYRDAERAQALMAELEAISALGGPNAYVKDSDEWATKRGLAYEKLLGARHVPGEFKYSDWQLCEIELVE